MMVKNPNYKSLLARYDHLGGVKIIDGDDRKEILIHVVLSAGEYAAIKTSTPQRVGSPGQPMAEKTHLGWTIMSPGQEDQESPLTDYEQLCALDVLGLADSHENDQQQVYEEFKEQLGRSDAGWYETKLPWKGNHPPLPSNERGSKRRLDQLIRKLEKNGQYAEYNEIIQDQLQQGVIEITPTEPTEKEYYIPHKGVTRKRVQSCVSYMMHWREKMSINHH